MKFVVAGCNPPSTVDTAVGTSEEIIGFGPIGPMSPKEASKVKYVGNSNPSSGVSGLDYKYNEGYSLKEIKSYIDETYKQHYSQNKYQATEFIIDSGHGTGFCLGNILKYAQRYGRKGDRASWRKDLMKVIHYAIIQLHVHDQETLKEKNNV